MSKYAEVEVQYRRTVKRRFWQLWRPETHVQRRLDLRQLPISDAEFAALRSFKPEQVIPFLAGRHSQMIRNGWHIDRYELKHVVEEHA